jgi:transcription elongation GreA/GreB family factor
MSYSSLKILLIQKCEDWIDQRIDTARKAMNDAQESANQEEKSSVGDKYETGRAMAQIERDKAAEQLKEAFNLKRVFLSFNYKGSDSKVSSGSLVITDNQSFFVAISIGKIIIDSTECLVVSQATPIGKLLMNKQRGDRFTFNNQTLTIQEIL